MDCSASLASVCPSETTACVKPGLNVQTLVATPEARSSSVHARLLACNSDESRLKEPSLTRLLCTLATQICHIWKLHHIQDLCETTYKH